MPEINEYERQRLDRIAANKAKIAELGLDKTITSIQNIVDSTKKAASAPRKRKTWENLAVRAPPRRSGRVAGSAPEFYNEDRLYDAIGIDRLDFFSLEASGRHRINLDPNRLAAIREARIKDMEVDIDDEDVDEHMITMRRKKMNAVARIHSKNKNTTTITTDGDAAAEGYGSAADHQAAFRRAPIDSGLGVRIQGGRIYDSKYGLTCHWCRQKTLEEHVTCTHPGCGEGRKLAVSLCKMCLSNRHGEDIHQAIASDCWVCPACRGSCGDGCRVCCNCGPCRKKAGLGPTHQLIKEARGAGFTNVHDFLVHKTTGDSPEAISGRKKQFDWGRWLEVPYDEAAYMKRKEEEEAALRATLLGDDGDDGGKEKEKGEGEVAITAAAIVVPTATAEAVVATDDDNDEDCSDEETLTLDGGKEGAVAGVDDDEGIEVEGPSATASAAAVDVDVVLVAPIAKKQKNMVDSTKVVTVSFPARRSFRSRNSNNPYASSGDLKGKKEIVGGGEGRKMGLASRTGVKA